VTNQIGSAAAVPLAMKIESIVSARKNAMPCYHATCYPSSANDGIYPWDAVAQSASPRPCLMP
jgi:hypothetical protein